MNSYTLTGILLSIAIGLAAGIGSYTFLYAKGGSYLTHDPAACANCHIMLEDQTYTERQIVVKQPGTCMHCHVSIYVPYMKLGNGDLIKGFEQMNQMPYVREGAMKISDHHVRSPLLNINRACQTCHKWPEEELRTRVEIIQERTYQLRNLAMNALVDLINDLKAARAAGMTDAELTKAWEFQRKGQFLLDFVEAENSTGFHAPQEAARILGTSIDFSRQGQVALRDVRVPRK